MKININRDLYIPVAASREVYFLCCSQARKPKISDEKIFEH